MTELATHPYATEIDAERRGWYEVTALVRTLTPAECVEPGYYSEPDWTVRDLIAHLGTWLAEAQVQFERMMAGTYEGHEIDIDAVNASLLEGMRGQPWEVAWIQANAARTMMIERWFDLAERTDEAAWWIRKAASDHYSEHVERLREWVGELVERRRDGASRSD